MFTGVIFQFTSLNDIIVCTTDKKKLLFAKNALVVNKMAQLIFWADDVGHDTVEHLLYDRADVFLRVDLDLRFAVTVDHRSPGSFRVKSTKLFSVSQTTNASLTYIEKKLIMRK